MIHGILPSQNNDFLKKKIKYFLLFQLPDACLVQGPGEQCFALMGTNEDGNNNARRIFS